MGLLGRHAIYLLGTGWIFILTFVDDLRTASRGGQRWRQIWRFIAAMEMIGNPSHTKSSEADSRRTMLGIGWMMVALKLVSRSEGPLGSLTL